MSIESNYAKQLMGSMHKLEPLYNADREFSGHNSQFAHYSLNRQKDYASSILDRAPRDLNPVQSRDLRQYNVPNLVPEISEDYSPLELIK